MPKQVIGLFQPIRFARIHSGRHANIDRGKSSNETKGSALVQDQTTTNGLVGATTNTSCQEHAIRVKRRPTEVETHHMSRCHAFMAPNRTTTWKTHDVRRKTRSNQPLLDVAHTHMDGDTTRLRFTTKDNTIQQGCCIQRDLPLVRLQTEKRRKKDRRQTYRKEM